MQSGEQLDAHHLITEAHKGQPKGCAKLDPRLLGQVEGLFCLCGGKGSLLAQRKSEELLRTYQRAFGKRLYVSISRAKQRLFLVGDATAFASNKTLSQAPEKFYTRLSSAIPLNL